MLIRAISERHQDGARALYDMYSDSLYGVISRIITDTQLAEDILQESFIRIWQAFDQYDSAKGRLFTWMVNIARHMAIDKLRSRNYRNDHLTGELDGCEVLTNAHLHIYDRIDGRLIRQGLKQLRDIELKVVELVYFGGYTHVEAAEALQIPLGTVKTHLWQAIRHLRTYYSSPELQLAS